MTTTPLKMTQGELRTVRVNSGDLPGLMPKGGRCQIMGVGPSQLNKGDIVVNHNGEFRRFWSADGQTIWLTNRSGLSHESMVVKDGVVRKVLVTPGLFHNLAWGMGAMAGQLRRKPLKTPVTTRSR